MPFRSVLYLHAAPQNGHGACRLPCLCRRGASGRDGRASKHSLMTLTTLAPSRLPARAQSTA